MKFKAQILCVLAGFIAFGCGGQPTRQTTIPNPLSVFKGSSQAHASSLDNDWICPPSANITLNNNVSGNGYDYSGARNYTVCATRNADAGKASRFLIIPHSTSQRTVCFYPMRASRSVASTPALKANPQCRAIQGTELELDFGQVTDINYMVVVDVNYTDAMNACLSGPSSCPAHSKGFVQ